MVEYETFDLTARVRFPVGSPILGGMGQLVESLVLEIRQSRFESEHPYQFIKENDMYKSKSMKKRLKIQMEAKSKKLEERFERRKKEFERRELEEKLDYLKVEELKDGYLYHILARNADYGIWQKDKGTFLISRFKFGDNYLFEEAHYDLSDDFGTVRPLMEIEKIPFYEEMFKIKDDKVLKYLNKFNVV
jgi:hypothetical protein